MSGTSGTSGTRVQAGQRRSLFCLDKTARFHYNEFIMYGYTFQGFTTMIRIRQV